MYAFTEKKGTMIHWIADNIHHEAGGAKIAKVLIRNGVDVNAVNEEQRRRFTAQAHRKS